MRTSMHKIFHQTRAFPAGCALVCFFTLFVIACSHPKDEQERRIAEARRLMYHHPDSALKLFLQVPDSTFSAVGMEDAELQSVYVFCADQLLEQGHPQEAKRWLDKVVDGQRKEYQQRLDEKRGALYRTSGSPYSHPAYWGMLVVLAGLLAGVLIYERKERQVKDLHSSVQNQSEEISLLTDQIHHLRNTTNEQLGRGRQWMERLEQGEPLKNISIEDEQCFVDYYAFVHPKDFQRIIQPFRSLSLRHTTYLILSEMGYTDKDIQRILLVKSSTIRNYRLRMNRNRRV